MARRPRPRGSVWLGRRGHDEEVDYPRRCACSGESAWGGGESIVVPVPSTREGRHTGAMPLRRRGLGIPVQVTRRGSFKPRSVGRKEKGNRRDCTAYTTRSSTRTRTKPSAVLFPATRAGWRRGLTFFSSGRFRIYSTWSLRITRTM